MPKISVIVPVYNREKTLDRCINSILNQTYRDLEILLVNDGSTDGSLEKCRDYAKKDKRVVVINKTNGGVSSARNTGIDNATGDYIAFVDSDDYIDVTMYEKLIEKAEGEQADLTVCKFSYVCTSRNIVEKSAEKGLHEAFINSDYNMFFGNQKNGKKVMGSVWRILFSRSIISGVRFNEKIIHAEDVLFVFQILSIPCKRYVVDEYLYFYEVEQNDDISKYFLKKNYVESQILLASELYNLLNKNSLFDELKYIMFQYWSNVVIAFCRKERMYKRAIKETKKREPFCYLNEKVVYKLFKRNGKQEIRSYKSKLLYWLIYRHHYGLIRLYFRLTGKVKITSND